MFRRALRIAAVLLLVVGLTVAVLLPDAYYGPCSVTTEFHCGYHPRTALSIVIGVISLVIAVSVWLATSTRLRVTSRHPRDII